MSTSSLPAETSQQLADAFGQAFAELNTLPHTQTLDEATQASLYAMACTHMQVGRFDSARQYFQLLVFYAPSHVDYLRGLATCASQLQDWATAANALGTALYVEPESCALALAWSESLYHLGMPRIAAEILHMVLRLATAPEDAPIAQRARLLLQSLQEPAPIHA